MPPYLGWLRGYSFPSGIMPQKQAFFKRKPAFFELINAKKAPPSPGKDRQGQERESLSHDSDIYLKFFEKRQAVHVENQTLPFRYSSGETPQFLLNTSEKTSGPRNPD